MRINGGWTRRICTAAAALLLLGLTAQTDIGEPFGLSTASVSEGPLWAAWRDLLPQIKADEETVQQCRREPKNCSSAAALRFIAIVDEGQAYQALARIGHINRAVNFVIKSFDLTKRVDDKWTSPLATLTTGIGDCKQFSVLKYAALIDAGFAPDDLRVTILNSKLRHEAHAVVAVRNDRRWIILDNRSLSLVDSDEILDRYIPLFVLDQHGVRQFVLPKPMAKGTDAIDAAACNSD
jgi:predicted transglutaminase-like cysteine proteinase